MGWSADAPRGFRSQDNGYAGPYQDDGAMALRLWQGGMIIRYGPTHIWGASRDSMETDRADNEMMDPVHPWCIYGTPGKQGA